MTSVRSSKQLTDSPLPVEKQQAPSTGDAEQKVLAALSLIERFDELSEDCSRASSPFAGQQRPATASKEAGHDTHLPPALDGLSAREIVALDTLLPPSVLQKAFDIIIHSTTNTAADKKRNNYKNNNDDPIANNKGGAALSCEGVLSSSSHYHQVSRRPSNVSTTASHHHAHFKDHQNHQHYTYYEGRGGVGLGGEIDAGKASRLPSFLSSSLDTSSHLGTRRSTAVEIGGKSGEDEHHNNHYPSPNHNFCIREQFAHEEIDFISSRGESEDPSDPFGVLGSKGGQKGRQQVLRSSQAHAHFNFVDSGESSPIVVHRGLAEVDGRLSRVGSLVRVRNVTASLAALANGTKSQQKLHAVSTNTNTVKTARNTPPHEEGSGVGHVDDAKAMMMAASPMFYDCLSLASARSPNHHQRSSARPSTDNLQSSGRLSEEEYNKAHGKEINLLIDDNTNKRKIAPSFASPTSASSSFTASCSSGVALHAGFGTCTRTDVAASCSHTHSDKNKEDIISTTLHSQGEQQALLHPSCASTPSSAAAPSLGAPSPSSTALSPASAGHHHAHITDELVPLVFASSGYGTVLISGLVAAAIAAETHNGGHDRGGKVATSHFEGHGQQKSIEEKATPAGAGTPSPSRRVEDEPFLPYAAKTTSRIVRRNSQIQSKQSHRESVVVPTAAERRVNHIKEEVDTLFCSIAGPNEEQQNDLLLYHHHASERAQSSSVVTKPPHQREHTTAEGSRDVLTPATPAVLLASGSCVAFPAAPTERGDHYANAAHLQQDHLAATTASRSDQLKSFSKANEAKGLQKQLKKRQIKELGERQLNVVLRRIRSALAALYELQNGNKDFAALPRDHPMRKGIKKRHESVMDLMRAYNAVTITVNIELAALGLPALIVEACDGSPTNDSDVTDYLDFGMSTGAVDVTKEYVEVAEATNLSRTASLSSIDESFGGISHRRSLGCSPLPIAVAEEAEFIRHPNFLGPNALAHQQQQQQQQQQQASRRSSGMVSSSTATAAAAATLASATPHRTAGDATSKRFGGRDSKNNSKISTAATRTDSRTPLVIGVPKHFHHQQHAHAGDIDGESLSTALHTEKDGAMESDAESTSSEERLIDDDEAEVEANRRRDRAKEVRAELARIASAAPAVQSDDTFIRENLHRIVPHTTFIPLLSAKASGHASVGDGQTSSSSTNVTGVGGVRRHSGIMKRSQSPSHASSSAAPLSTTIHVTLKLGEILSISKEIIPSQGKFADCRFLTNGHGPDGVRYVLLKLRKIDSADLLFGSEARASVMGEGRVLSGNEARVLTWFFEATAAGESTIILKETQISASANANVALALAQQQQQQQLNHHKQDLLGKEKWATATTTASRQSSHTLGGVTVGAATGTLATSPTSRASSALGGALANVVVAVPHNETIVLNTVNDHHDPAQSSHSGTTTADLSNSCKLSAAAVAAAAAAAAQLEQSVVNQHGHTTIFSVTVLDQKNRTVFRK